MPTKSKGPFWLGQLKDFGQAKRALGKVIRATACGKIERPLGATLAFQLGVLIKAFEVEDGTLIRQRLDELNRFAVSQASEHLSERGGSVLIEQRKDEPLQ
jgi:hypothetical protein